MRLNSYFYPHLESGHLVKQMIPGLGSSAPPRAFARTEDVVAFEEQCAISQPYWSASQEIANAEGVDSKGARRETSANWMGYFERKWAKIEARVVWVGDHRLYFLAKGRCEIGCYFFALAGMRRSLFKADFFRNPRWILEWRFIGEEWPHTLERISQAFLAKPAPSVTEIVKSPVAVSAEQ
jgi:hypothetical protein